MFNEESELLVGCFKIRVMTGVSWLVDDILLEMRDVIRNPRPKPMNPKIIDDRVSSIAIFGSTAAPNIAPIIIPAMGIR